MFLLITSTSQANSKVSLEPSPTGLSQQGVAWSSGVFLAGQLMVWWQLGSGGYAVDANPANSFFYLLTGLHGLHLMGGLVAWGIFFSGTELLKYLVFEAFSKTTV